MRLTFFKTFLLIIGRKLLKTADNRAKMYHSIMYNNLWGTNKNL